ncbi:adenylate synthase [Nocardioides albidus]|uniref:Adenylate synthase n=1 Tax=Nocardioides albidus TaxID=1517589 RepID=A0A5C4VLA8_9ACTN|nr:F390 synthetase-related protein [Nocardioides albidus]TNM36425.1 adenylate synthase [Nocardioides albidus]
MAGSEAAVAAAFARERWLLPRRYDAARARALERFLRVELPKARFYGPFAGRPLSELPVVDKRTVLADFAAFNRHGITLDRALAVAEAAERSRSFAERLPGGVTVGLSSGTSGTRGVFLVSEAESRLWAGILMGQLMSPLSLRTMARRPLRVALFLRANSNLYETLDSRRVAFSWHDLTVPLSVHLPALAGTDVLVAPAGVLRRIAEARPRTLRPLQVVSVAETLEPDDEAVIRAAFGRPVEQIYQATEGLLAVSCPAGRLHLNEAHVHIEPEWIDHQRFHPIVTDFTRTTQYVVRHRLDDVLLAAPGPCPCGRPGRSIHAVLGRADDVLTLGDVPVYPDVLRHAVALAGDLGDYRIEQHGTEWRLATTAGSSGATERVATQIGRLAQRLGARPPAVVPMAWPAQTPDQKRRRIRRIR